MLRVALAGVFAARLETLIRARLRVPCDLVSTDETAIVPRLGDVDVLVTLAFTRAMGAAARRLKLVQVPGAGLDRIDRSALPAGTWLANAYGHETGIAEYVIGVSPVATKALFVAFVTSPTSGVCRGLRSAHRGADRGRCRSGAGW